jgi:hypothetical protein
MVKEVNMIKLTKMIYLASPYSNSDKEISTFRYEEVTRVAGLLQEEYPYAFILPITMSHNTEKYMKIKDSSFKHWATRDFTYISRCDEIWVVAMSGWNESLGVIAEIKFAKDKNILIKYVCPTSLLVTTIPPMFI